MTGFGFSFFLYSWLSLWAVDGNISEATETIPAQYYPTLETSVDRNELRIGDVFHLSLTLTHDPDVAVQSPEQNLNLGQFEIRDILPGKTQTLPDGRLQQTIDFELSTYFTGDFEIPAFNIGFETPEGQSGTIRTTPIEISVIPLTPEESENLDIRDIKEPVVLEGESRLWMVITALVLVLLAALAAYYLWRYYRKRGEIEPALPPLAPHEKAFQALAALREEREIFEQKQFKIFSFRVSEIIRVYIQERWHINAMDETSEEILSELKKIQLSEELLNQFREFFISCDLIKFARHEPTQEDMFNTIDQAEEIVRYTTQMDESDEQSSESSPQEELQPAGKEAL